MAEITVIVDTDEADITVTTNHTDVITLIDIEEDTTQVTQVQVTSTTEHLQAGIHQKHGAIPLERGSRTCRLGYI